MDRINKYKYPGAKRLMLEAQELKDNTEDYWAQPIEDNLFEWHFTVRGPPDTVFDGGYYHGRISFPTDYPMKPPSIILLTPNGRFETNKKICLSISGYHPETWQPSWSIRTALLALIAFMPTKANGAIGSLDLPDLERRRLAKKSQTWKCEKCGLIKDLLVHPKQITSTNSTDNSDKIPMASSSDSFPPSSIQCQNGFKNGSIQTHKKIDVSSTSNTKDEENSLECSKSSTNCRVRRRINAENLESDCTNHKVDSEGSSLVAEGNARQDKNESNLNIANQQDQTRIDTPQEQFVPQIIPRPISNQRSYSMIIFGMAAVLIFLILRRLFFVVL